VAEVLPLLYLHGLSSSDFGPALEQFLGTGQGLSAATVTRLTKDRRREVAQSGREITDDLDVLLAFYDFPGEHWIHLRTTNPIESTFATVRLRQRVTQGPGSRAAGMAMAFKLIESADPQGLDYSSRGGWQFPWMVICRCAVARRGVAP
jgi:hypothetical protein